MAWLAASVVLAGCSATVDQVKENVETALVEITLEPFDPYAVPKTDPGGGLRSILLHAGHLRVEPHAVWSDGTAISADTRLSTAEMLRLIEALDDLGLIRDATPYASIAREPPRSSPPIPISPHPDRPHGRTCSVTITFTRDDHHIARVATVPWGRDTLRILNAIKPHTPAGLAEKMISTCERFP